MGSPLSTPRALLLAPPPPTLILTARVRSVTNSHCHHADHKHRCNNEMAFETLPQLPLYDEEIYWDMGDMEEFCEQEGVLVIGAAVVDDAEENEDGCDQGDKTAGEAHQSVAGDVLGRFAGNMEMEEVLTEVVKDKVEDEAK